MKYYRNCNGDRVTYKFIIFRYIDGDLIRVGSFNTLKDAKSFIDANRNSTPLLQCRLIIQHTVIDAYYNYL